MSKIEMKARLEELNRKKFNLNMIDRWTREDYDFANELTKEIIELEKALAD